MTSNAHSMTVTMTALIGLTLDLAAPVALAQPVVTAGEVPTAAAGIATDRMSHTGAGAASCTHPLLAFNPSYAVGSCPSRRGQTFVSR